MFISRFSPISRRRRRLRDIRNRIEATWDLAFRADIAGESDEAARLYGEWHRLFSQLRAERQRPLTYRATRLGLEIPDNKFEAARETGSNNTGRLRAGMQRPLTEPGEAWLRREVRKERRATIEFYGRLVLPIAALVVSIIALLHKTSK